MPQQSDRKKVVKGIQTGREEVKLPLFAENMIIYMYIYIYIYIPKVSTKKQLEVINEFSKVAGYKIKIQKSVAFLFLKYIF